jgi:CRP-like cAMP-binding protein
MKAKRLINLVCAAKYEVEHSENSLEFPTLYAVLAICINKIGIHVYALSNGLIAQLDAADQALLLRRAKIVVMNVGDVLSSSDATTLHIYFPVSGSIALYVGRQGKSASVGMAVGLIGAEGAAGLQAALGFGTGNLRLVVQSAGQAYAVDGAMAQRLVQRRRTMLLQFSRYLWTVFDNIAMLASRPYTQDIKIRLAHWLLLSAQRCAPDPLVLTHAQIAQMLGVRRASISIAAREMKLKRYISYSRGHITLLNVPALQALARTPA